MPYLSVANVQDRHLDLSSVKTIEASDAEVARYRLLPGDLLLTEGGDPDKLGRGTVWAGEVEECIHQNHVFRVRITDGSVTPTFLNWLVGSERGKQYFLRAAKQTTGIASINKTQLSDFPLLTPPIDVQEEFAARLRKVEHLRCSMDTSMRAAEAMLSSLQHRAFTGSL